MTILFVTPYFSRIGEELKGGGLEIYLRRVAGALREMGHLPIILSFGPKEMHYADDGIDIYFVYCSQKKLGKGNFNRFYERVYQSCVINRKIAKLLREIKVDIIQFPSPYSLSLCYFGKIPAIMRLSSYSKICICNENEKYAKEKMQIWGMCERLAANRCNAVFAPSTVVANIFSQDIHRPVSVIESPFYVDCHVLDSDLYQQYLYDKKYCLFFGRLDVNKGVLVIAECLNQFLHANPAYYFVCCGDDYDINGKRAVHILRNATGAFKERFLYFRTLSHEVLYPIIQHADLVICPSLKENLSNSCIEAMYFERVVIGTDGASYEQLIDDGESGLLCIPGDSASLLRKMNEATAMSDEQKSEMGIKAKARIDKLSPEHVVTKLMRYYQWVIDNVNK